MKTANEWTEVYHKSSKIALSEMSFTLAFDVGIMEVVRQAKQEVFDDLGKIVPNNMNYKFMSEYIKIKDRHLHPITDSKPQASELPLKSDLCPNCEGESFYGISRTRCERCKGKGRL